MTILFECGFAFFFSWGLVICDVGHMALFLVTMVTLDGTIINCFFDLKKIIYYLMIIYFINHIVKRFKFCLDFGAIHKWLHLLRGEVGSAKRWHNSISLLSKMGDKGEEEVKNFKKWVTSFMYGLHFKYCLDISNDLYIKGRLIKILAGPGLQEVRTF